MTCDNCGKELKDGDMVRALEEGVFKTNYGPADCPEADAIEITKTIKRAHINCQYPKHPYGD